MYYIASNEPQYIYIYISNVMVCNNTDLPDALGPRIIERMESFGAIAYLLWFTSYCFTSTGLIIGVLMFYPLE